ncbi:MAG: peptidoglycan DD-metalloendopeptidase family protein [Clostridia bacterium]|nr:peptidoglycan DD-metalloendopeptidase family protein [Clostridia bacterium]
MKDVIKKYISIFFVLIMVFSMVPQTGFAAAVSTAEFDGVIFDPSTEVWHWPLLSQTKTVTSKFAENRTSWRNPHFHQGIDIGGRNINGVAKVYAARDGVVLEARKGNTFGNYVKIYHGKDKNGKLIISTYMHMYDNSLAVKAGQKVYGGKTVLGKVGNTGSSTGPHLHFQVAKTYSINVANPAHKTYAEVTKNFYNTNVGVMKYVYNSNTSTIVTAEPTATPTPTTSTLKINITSYPTTINQGSSFGLRGNVSSNYKLTSVNGYILSSDGKTIIQGAYDKQNIYNVDIRTSVVNQKLLFDKLSPGSYIYKVTAWDESGANRVWSKPFTVKGKESTLKINITSAPTTIKKGSMFGLRGNVTSNYKLTSVNGYILSSDGKTIIQGAYDKQNIYNVDIRTSVVNQKLLFDKLSRGSYIFKVTAWDESGANKIWSKPFTVK